MFVQLLTEKQISPISSEVLARISIIRPILTGLLMGIKQEVLEELGGADNVKLKMLPRAYRPGAGDIGFCFEWAIHDAVKRRDPMVLERLEDAAKKCRLPGHDFESILFGLEKSGKVQVLDTANNILTPDSRILTGERAQPLKLKGYLNMLSAAFYRPETRKALPFSISGLWKADLFFGATDSDRWLGTSLKINPSQLEGARGLRIGIVPSMQGRSDKVYLDEKKNMMAKSGNLNYISIAGILNIITSIILFMVIGRFNIVLLLATIINIALSVIMIKNENILAYKYSEEVRKYIDDLLEYVDMLKKENKNVNEFTNSQETVTEDLQENENIQNNEVNGKEEEINRVDSDEELKILFGLNNDEDLYI